MSGKESHSEIDKLIARFLSGELAPEELREFREMLSRNPENRARADEFRKIWDAVDDPSVSQSYDLDAEWKLMKQQIPELSKTRSLFFYAYRIAAILVMGLLIGVGWTYGTRMLGTEKRVAHGQSMEIILDDGSHVILNRNSKIRYKKSFASTERKVTLTGEAWFDVARDTLKPFVIDAGPARVEVLGTSFNVNAYLENESIEITVESGLVALSAPSEKEEQKEQLILRAGNGGSYHKKKQELILVETADPNRISWKTRELYFENATLREVVSLVNEVYGAKLVILNKELAACPITVTFSNQTLEAILNVLTETLDLQLSQAGDEIRLDGAACN